MRLQNLRSPASEIHLLARQANVVKHLRIRSWAFCAAAAILVVSASSSSFAADAPARPRKAKPATTRVASTAKKSAPAAGAAGMRVAIDPQTGLLIKPTLEQRHMLGTSAELERSSDGLVIVTLADGTKLCNLQGRFQEYVVARKDGAGQFKTDCVESHDRARRLTATPVPARTGLVRADESTRVKE